MEAGVEDEACEGHLFGVEGDFDAVFAVGEGGDFVDGEVDAFGGVFCFFLDEFLVPGVFAEFAVFVHGEVFVFAFFDFFADAGFDGGGVFDGFLAEDHHHVF